MFVTGIAAMFVTGIAAMFVTGIAAMFVTKLVVVLITEPAAVLVPVAELNNGKVTCSRNNARQSGQSTSSGLSHPAHPRGSKRPSIPFHTVVPMAIPLSSFGCCVRTLLVHVSVQAARTHAVSAPPPAHAPHEREIPSCPA